MATFAPTLYDSPALANYSFNTAPIIGTGPRAAYQQLGRYINPDTSFGSVHLQTLADALETSTSTVSRYLQVAADGGLLVKHPQKAPTGYTFNIYEYARGFAANWQPDPKPSLGNQTIATHNLKELTRQRDRVEELEAELARLKGCDPATGEIVGSEPLAAHMQAGGICKLEEEEEEEIAIPNYENVNSSSFSVPDVAPSDPLACHMQAAYDFTNPPREFDEAYVRASLQEYGKDDGQKWEWPNAAVNTYREDWNKYRVELAQWRMTRAKAMPKPAKNYGSELGDRTPIAAESPTFVPPMSKETTIECEGCGKEVRLRSILHPRTNPDAKVCGKCWERSWQAIGTGSE